MNQETTSYTLKKIPKDTWENFKMILGGYTYEEKIIILIKKEIELKKKILEDLKNE